MDAFVSLQVTSFDKGLSTHVTHKGSLTCVDSLVHLQVIRLSKRFLTNITKKGFLTSVDPFMSLQVTDSGKALTANVTHMPPGFVCVHVVISLTVVTPATVRSRGLWKHSLQCFSVRVSHVNFQTAELIESSTALLTHKRPVQG